MLTLPLVATAAWLTACRDGTDASAPESRGDLALPPRTNDVRYLAGSTHPKHTLDVYAPPRATGVPFVHFVHGGYWVSGDKDGDGHGLYASIGHALAKRGVGCVIQSYRLAPEVGIEGMIADVQAAVRWTVDHVEEHGGDPERVVMMGHSAGGHLVALLGADPARRPEGVSGYVPLSAIWDVADMHDTQGVRFNNSVTYPVFGDDPTAYASFSPMTYLDASTPRMRVTVGSRDFDYMIPQAHRAHEKLAAAGAAATLDVIEGNSHMDMVQLFGSAEDNMTGRVASFAKG